MKWITAKKAINEFQEANETNCGKWEQFIRLITKWDAAAPQPPEINEEKNDWKEFISNWLMVGYSLRYVFFLSVI